MGVGFHKNGFIEKVSSPAITHGSYCKIANFYLFWDIQMMMMMIMNCFCGMVDRQKVFCLISSWDHCHKSSPSWISDMPQAGFEPVQNLSSGLVEWSCAVVITTTQCRALCWALCWSVQRIMLHFYKLP